MKKLTESIENNTDDEKFYTITEFAKLHNLSVIYQQNVELGKKAINYCNEYGLHIDRKPGVDPDTTINSYPYDVLKVTFEDYFGIKL